MPRELASIRGNYSLFLEQLVKHLETVLLLKLVLFCGIACLSIVNIRENSNVSTFKKLLKTFLFTKTFG
jgi:hypothetical protein